MPNQRVVAAQQSRRLSTYSWYKHSIWGFRKTGVPSQCVAKKEEHYEAANCLAQSLAIDEA